MALRFYLMSDEDKANVATYFVNNSWDIYPPESGKKSRCEICRLDKNCTGHYGYLDLGIVIVHPMFVSKVKHIKLYDEMYCSGEYPGLLMRYILIPPPSIRGRDDVEWPNELSRLYMELIKTVRHRKDTNEKYRESIQSKVSELFGAKKKSGIIELLSGKSGVFRKIAYGKRVESSARSVITGDPCLEIDQVWIPKVLAKDLFMKCTIEDDDKAYFIEKELPLDKHQAIPGMEAIRRIHDNDLIFINRQPTLSYGSILTFRAKIRKDEIKTIGIHPNVTKTFNADFDGDEMNLFCFPYSQDLEKCHITNFPECICEIQDTKVATYLSNPHLDSYGLTVSLRDLVHRKYDGTGLSLMIESTSKGNRKNAEQMMDKVGTQYLAGQPIGECTSSYVKGLNIDEFFIHQRAAREGIVGTGVNTSDTGYINRKGARIMADVIKEGKYIRDHFGIVDFL